MSHRKTNWPPTQTRYRDPPVLGLIPGPRARVRRPHQAMGGLFDTLVTVFGGGVRPLLSSSTFGSGGSDQACAAARKQAEVDLDAKTHELSLHWKPTGYYLVADMVKMRDQILAILADASRAIDVAAMQPLQMRETLRQAQALVQSKMRGAQTYTDAIAAAQQQGIRVIDAPAFRSWVMDSLTKASLCYGQIAWENCIKPGILKAFEQVKRAWDVAVLIGKAMVRATIALGEQILKIPDALATLWTITKWGGLAYVAFLALRKKKPGPGAG